VLSITCHTIRVNGQGLLAGRKQKLGHSSHLATLCIMVATSCGGASAGWEIASLADVQTTTP
jgi:hypothetical protein